MQRLIKSLSLFPFSSIVDLLWHREGLSSFTRYACTPVTALVIIAGGGDVTAHARPRILQGVQQSHAETCPNIDKPYDSCPQLLSVQIRLAYQTQIGAHFGHELNYVNQLRTSPTTQISDFVTLYGSGHGELFEANILYGAQIRKPESSVAVNVGNCQQEMHPLDKGTIIGQYMIRGKKLWEAMPQDVDRTAAERASAEGDQLRAQGNAESLKRAIERYETAEQIWRVLGDKAKEAETLNNIGEINDSLGEKRKALEYYNQALPLMRAVGDHNGEATTLHNIGTAYDALGEKQTAVDHYNQALQLWRATGDRGGEAVTLSGIGLVYSSLGEMQKALDYHNQALLLRRAVGDRRGEATTLNNIGTTYDALGEKQKALDYHNQALLLRRAFGDRRGEANSLNNIGLVYDSIGESRKALDYYDQALPLRRAVGDRRGEAITLNNIGLANWSLGKFQEALVYYDQALPLLRAVGNRSGEANTLHNIGAAYEYLGEKPRALEYYNQALPLRRAVSDRRGEAKTLNNIGKVYDSMGERQKALEYYDHVLSLWRAVGDRSGEAITLSHIARIERDRGNFTEARARTEAALQIIESLRMKVISHELRASYFASVQRYYEFYIALLMRLHRDRPSEGFEAVALQASERARARTLIELLAESRADIRQGVDPKLVERERSLQQRLNAKAQRKMQLLNGPHTPEQAKAIDSDIEALTTELQQVEAHIRQTSPRYAALTQPQPLALREIHSLLDRDTVLLEYALGPEHSYVWVVTSDALATHELAGRGEIETLALQTYELLTARNRRQKKEIPEDRRRRIAEADALYWKKATELSQLILTPVAAHLKDKRLIVVADGALQKIPFAALPSLQPRPVKSPSMAASGIQSNAGARRTSGGMRPLIADHEIVSLPSASVLASLRREAAGRVPAPKAVAVFADPIFDTSDVRFTGKTPASRPAAPSGSATPARRDDDLESTLRSTGTADDSLSIPRLFASRREAEAIAALAPVGSSLKALDFDASRALATDPRMRQYRIIHFATHALVNYEHPGLSGLILSLVDERGAPRDGFLRLHDIFNLRLNADLVVLSACNTSLGKDIVGEGLVGLTRGFMYAGSPRVIASLWKVDDDATAVLMRRTYQRMLAGRQSPATALRGAQVEMWQQKNRSAPYYWAAFTLQGEWR